MSKELIIEKILSDAKAKADEIIASAKQKADKILKDAKAGLDNDYEKSVQEAKALVPELLRRKLSVAELESKKILLNSKQKVLEKVFAGAVEDIRALSNEKYLEYIEKMLLANAEDGDEVIVAESDKKIVTRDFIEKVAKQKGIKLKLKSEYGSFIGGLILVSRCCSKNMTLELELALLREEKEAKIARMIFQGE